MKPIPMLDLHYQYLTIKKDIDEAIQRCLEHQKWILGPEVGELEKNIAGYLGVKHCIGVSSGTEALVLSLRALAVSRIGEEYFTKEDLIITTPFTFTATGDAIIRSGATPVFVDIDPNTYNIDITKVRQFLATDEGNKAIGVIPVHLYGLTCDMDSLERLAQEHKLFVVEDVAQAFGSAWKGRRAGAIGDTGCHSFFPSKNLGGFGDGGMVSTNDDELANSARMLIKHGGRDKYNVDHIGYNARLDTLQAAILLAKFKHIDEFNRRRAAIAKRYNEGLADISELRLPSYPGAEHVYHQYTLFTTKRDELQKHLADAGISSMVYYPFPLHKMKVFQGRSLIYGALEEAERASQGVLSLPIEPLQAEEDTNRIIESIRNFFA